MAGYQELLAAHLGRYRAERLGVAECGIWTYKGVERPYAHILPSDLSWLNIPEGYRSEVREYVQRRQLRLHRFFHHLNSSQALALSLFVPYALRAPLELAAVMDEPAMASLELESVPVPEEGTNVDVQWSANGAPVYCEVKLSEAEFGTASADAAHTEKLERFYRGTLAPHVPAEMLEPRAFFGAYQIFRNLWLVARTPGARVVFFLPEGNNGLRLQLQSVLAQISPALRERTKVLYLESVLTTLAQQNKPSILAWYAQQLVEKYVPA